MFTRKKETPAPVALTPLEAARPVAQPQPVPQPQQQPPQPARPKTPSVFTQGLTIRGDIVGDVEVHLDSLVMGDIKVGKLMVGPNARVEGSIIAQVVEIHGLVIGSVTAQAVRLYAGSRVDGDITHEQLAMETGAIFEGRSQKFRRPAAQPAPQQAVQNPAAAPLQTAPAPANAFGEQAQSPQLSPLPRAAQ